jgi:hydrogenase maturation protein HypF
MAIAVWGTVQGVGFRPFVYAAANERRLSGWVRNASDAVRIEVQGAEHAVREFLEVLRTPPPAARIERVEALDIGLEEESGFRILDSAPDGNVRITLPADLAICRDCITELEDPHARRSGYAFTNCTQCGPRYSIVEALPYDRANTSMRRFALCAACAREYSDVADRRFHAQPLACPTCGPRVTLLSAAGARLAEGAGAIAAAAASLVSGQILACKGLGGFQLLVDGTNEQAVRLLRERKGRDEKPFALMFASLEAMREECALSNAEEQALCSPAAPIVLAQRRVHASSRLAAAVAPRNPRLGVMLPYTPLHRILMAAVARPLVCTSANLAGEPICIDDRELENRLDGVADLVLTHDRPIVRPIDDSVARIASGDLQLLRRARGYAPLPLRVRGLGSRSILATGAQLKSTIALAKGGEVVVSQHLGDLSSAESVASMKRTVCDLTRLLEVRPEIVSCDLHPDYASTVLAEALAAEWNVPLERVQHHHAHIAASMAEHGLRGPVLGLAWDGSGLGSDGALWGGEALAVDGASFCRVAHLRPFSLPGGESAMRDPTRSALGLLYEVFGRDAIDYIEMEPARARTLLSMLDAGVNCPSTCSMGRLFDAVAAITRVRERAGYEGQAAMELEFALDGATDCGAYRIALGDGVPAIADWEPLLHALLFDSARGLAASVMSARFHNALVDLAEEMALRAGMHRVVLSGGCFQNVRLVEAVLERLRARRFEVFTSRLYPPNDGGLSLGQLYVAALREGAA